MTKKFDDKKVQLLTTALLQHIGDLYQREGASIMDGLETIFLVSNHSLSTCVSHMLAKGSGDAQILVDSIRRAYSTAFDLLDDKINAHIAERSERDDKEPWAN